MKYVEKIVEVLIFVILIAMVLMVFANVVARYVFSSSLTWAHELARYFFVWLTFLGAAVGLARGAHIGMDLLTARVGARTRQIMALLTDAAIGLFVYVWFRYGFRLIEVNKGYFGPGSGIPMTLVYAISPVASTLMALFLVQRITAHLKGETVQ